MRTIASVWSRRPFDCVHVNRAPVANATPVGCGFNNAPDDVFAGSFRPPAAVEAPVRIVGNPVQNRPRIDTDGVQLSTSDAEIVARYNADPEQLTNDELCKIARSVKQVTERGNLGNDKRIARERVSIYERLLARDPNDLDFRLDYQLVLHDAVWTYWFGMSTLTWFAMGWDSAIPAIGKPPADLLMASLKAQKAQMKEWGSGDVDIACTKMLLKHFHALSADCCEYFVGPFVEAYLDLAKRQSSRQDSLAWRNRQLAFALARLRDSSPGIGK